MQKVEQILELEDKSYILTEVELKSESEAPTHGASCPL